MRKLTFLFFGLIASIALVNAQGNPPREIIKYYFVDLITNTDRPELPKSEVDSIQKAHMANISKMVKDEKLVLAGPFEGGGGIFILKVDSKEEAERLVAQDPAVAAGRLTTRIRAWYTASGSFMLEEQFGKKQPNK